MTPKLFEPITIRGLNIPHRLWVAPMCQYSAVDGLVQPWHAVHLGSWAAYRAGLIITEATAVSPEGRISKEDVGIWNDEHVKAWQPITAFSRSQGVPLCVQLAHAGRKASTRAPFKKGESALGPDEGAWQALAPSAEPFGRLPVPHELSVQEIEGVVEQFATAAQRAVAAGFDAVEIHAAHGYLLHEFLSPLANLREDDYGGEFDGRVRIVRETLQRVRAVLPDSMPLFVRISATDWLEGGWDVQQSSQLAQLLQQDGVDFIDVSSGGLRPDQKIELGPGYQMPFARAISESVSIPTGTVGLITSGEQAEAALQDGVADVVLMGRQFLREPSFALRAAAELGAELAWPGQYERAKPI
jgi:2,4-dienoyl-CoA reductase-like NADH-dependent reductase (Old Yellow Enzyme family)